MSDTTSTPEDGITRICCLCFATGPEVVLAGTGGWLSGPAVEYWACPACAPTVARICGS
ncbi:hypothetical protein [Kitasatospora cineracea]|uniref:Uncharacterized protein n=1 Tax=Kitasatospora cineracea TaxID=88074 RepID=A0A3N4S9U0_9ACTN|nr:hypothetical protein [Kitasatospora cineracea]RPE33214.1 hypothetical protein EDD38_1493 [Kitasatospora cineracea]